MENNLCSSVICGSFIHPWGRFHPWERYSLGNISLDLYSHRLHRFSDFLLLGQQLLADGRCVVRRNKSVFICEIREITSLRSVGLRQISCSKITSVCRILISMSSEKIISVHQRNLREINTMNNPRVKNIFLFFICHSVILSCNTLIINKITC